MTTSGLGIKLDLVGVVSRLQSTEHAGQQVREFVVTTPDGLLVPVELRGDRISGVLGDGDEVKIAVPDKFMDAEDRTQRPLKLVNATTGGVVTVFRAGLLQHAARAGMKTLGDAWKALIAGLIGALLVFFGVKKKQAQGIAPAPEQWDVSVLVWLLIGSLPVIALIGYFTVYRPWRWRGGSLPIWRLVDIWLGTWVVLILVWSVQRFVGG